MDEDALKIILEDMKQNQGKLPELKAGKLYWVKPVGYVGDTTNLVGYVIKQFTPDQKHSHYLVIVSTKQASPIFSTGTTSGKPGKIKITTNQNYFSFDTPVMILKNKGIQEETDYIDLLVGEKAYRNIVFDPFNSGWELVPIET